MDYKNSTTKEKQEYIELLKRIGRFKCPPNNWRVPSETNCFNCIDCISAALKNSIDNNLEC